VSDLTILRGLLSREYFDNFADLLQRLPTLEYETRTILKAISDYYQEYPDATGLSPDELRVWFWARNKTIRGRETYEVLLAEIKSLEITNTDLLRQELVKTAERHLATEFSQELLKVIEGQQSLREVLAQFNETFTKRIGEVEEASNDPLKCLVRAPDTVEELLAATKIEGPLWPIKFLNDTIGPIAGGSLGHIFAPPETGKTSFAAAVAAYCAYQYRNDPHTILYMGNEEKIETQKLRCTISLIGKPHEWILANPKEATELFVAKGGKNLIFYGELPSVDLVEVAVDKHNPTLVLLDQSVKLSLGRRGTSEMAKHERLAAIYNRLRTLATHTGTRILGVGQADNNAANKKWLSLHNMDGSKVGLPGELDYAIGIGRVDDPARKTLRYFNICKNKLRGIQDRATVQFDNQLVRWSQ